MARKKNPSPLMTAGLFALGVVGVIGAAVAADTYQQKKSAEKAKKKKEDDEPKVSPLSGVYAPGATVGNAPLVVNDVMIPIELTFEPKVRDLEGEIRPAGGNIINSQLVLESLVSNLTQLSNEIAYENMLHLVANRGYDLTDPTARDEAVQKTVSLLAPKVDWTQGLGPYTYGSPEFDVWLGAQMLGEIAYQSYWNKQAAKA